MNGFPLNARFVTTHVFPAGACAARAWATSSCIRQSDILDPWMMMKREGGAVA